MYSGGFLLAVGEPEVKTENSYTNYPLIFYKFLILIPYFHSYKSLQ